MIYGITGNISKEALWDPVARLIAWLQDHQYPFFLQTSVAAGLASRKLVDPALCESHSMQKLARHTDVILSFGGDGTLLRAAHEAGTHGTPLLGINIGRLGFLADVETGCLDKTMEALTARAFTIDKRLVLAVVVEQENNTRRWALNDIVLARAGSTGLIAVDVKVNGTPLNRYWADGLILSTPTGSTAYSLAIGGPIIAPGSNVILLSPIAPHSLTARPIVLPSHSIVDIRVTGGHLPYVLAVDGTSSAPRRDSVTFTVRRAAHSVKLIKLDGNHYFQTLRNKLAWGVGPQGETEG